MVEECVEPYVITFVCLLSICRIASLVDEGMHWYASMITIYTISAKLEYEDETQKQEGSGWKLPFALVI